ncbi:hypothetical protein AB0F15_00250 [Amycolatopsis sp. NPDC026612]|uniref:hypothetical protein n=1 Tax=Amycolatopsis sp. NPDC026612 TaxID=3155466 RepID=UPI0033E98108
MSTPLEDLFDEALDHLDTAMTLLGTHHVTRATCPDGIPPAFWDDYITRMRTAMTKANVATSEAVKTLQNFESEADVYVLAHRYHHQ